MKLILILVSIAFTISLKTQEETIIPITSKPATQNDSAAVVEDDVVFTIVQEMPKYPGGKDAMFDFIGHQMHYPEEAIEQGIQGMVYVQLIINKDGCIDTAAIQILRGVHPLLDNEAIRIVKKMPCWEPGYQRGKAKRVYYNLPFRFTLSK